MTWGNKLNIAKIGIKLLEMVTPAIEGVPEIFFAIFGAKVVRKSRKNRGFPPATKKLGVLYLFCHGANSLLTYITFLDKLNEGLDMLHSLVGLYNEKRMFHQKS